MNDASEGCLKLSEGSVYGFCRKFSDLAKTEIEKQNEHLLNQPVVATDATTVSLNGKQGYIRNISDEEAVVYYGMEKKTKTALEEIPFLAAIREHCCTIMKQRCISTGQLMQNAMYIS